jgi:UPF0271 protein
MSEGIIIILDTSVFISGFNPSSLKDKFYTVPSVEEELIKDSIVKVRFNTAVESGKIKIRKPENRYLNIVKQSSKEVGDMLLLSKADNEVLALALQLRDQGYVPTIATDDYSIQNVARKINMNYIPITTYGIKYFLHWLLYCPACHQKYPADSKIHHCRICGTRLKRKPLKKKMIQKQKISMNEKIGKGFHK